MMNVQTAIVAEEKTTPGSAQMVTKVIPVTTLIAMVL